MNQLVRGPIFITICFFLIPTLLVAKQDCSVVKLFNDADPAKAITIKLKNSYIKKHINTIHGTHTLSKDQDFYVTIFPPVSHDNVLIKGVKSIWIIPAPLELKQIENRNPKCVSISSNKNETICVFMLTETTNIAINFIKVKGKNKKYLLKSKVLVEEIKKSVVCK